MKRTLTTTALATLIATGALAQGGQTDFIQSGDASHLRGSDLIGMNIYAAEFEDGQSGALSVENGTLMASGSEVEWQDVGEVNDLILTRDGEVTAVLFGIGGFLGIGEKSVAMPMDRVEFVNVAARDAMADNMDGEQSTADAGVRTGRYHVVVNATEDDLREAPAFDRASLMPRQGTDAGDGSQTGMAGDEQRNATITGIGDEEQQSAANTGSDANTTANESGEGDMASNERSDGRYDIDVDGFDQLAATELTAEDLTGNDVYGANEEHVGEVSQLIVTEQGEIEQAIVDVGGFLGLGEKRVAVPFAELSVQHNGQTGETRIFIDATEESLENRQSYDG